MTYRKRLAALETMLEQAVTREHAAKKCLTDLKVENQELKATHEIVYRACGKTARYWLERWQQSEREITRLKEALTLLCNLRRGVSRYGVQPQEWTDAWTEAERALEQRDAGTGEEGC